MLFRAGIELGFNFQEGQKFFFFSVSRGHWGPQGIFWSGTQCLLFQE